jgi:hypothetical protein
MPDPSARLREQARWVLLGIAAITLVVHSLQFNFVTDDAYISFVFSRNFAEHGELTFNLGDRVEGYTNFSWTVLLGLLMKLGIAPELSSRVLGTLCAIGTLYVAMRTMDRALGRRSVWAVLPAFLLAWSSGFACWTSGGLETQLFTLLVVASLDAVVAAVADPRALRRAAICLALAAMTRPEGPVVAAVLGTVWLVHRWLERRARRPVPEAIALEKLAPPSARVRRALAVVAAALFVWIFLEGGIHMATGYDALASALRVPVLPIVVLLAFIGLPLFGLYDCARAARGNVRALEQSGAVLLVLGLSIMGGSLRTEIVFEIGGWNAGVVVALASIAVGSAMLGVAFASTPRKIRPELVAAAWFVGLWTPWFLWRWWYYGYPFPNTYYVKAAGAWTNPDYASQMRDHGLYYVWAWLVQTRLIFALPLVLLGVAAIRPRTPRFVLGAASGLLLVVYLAYTVTVGGDFMGLHRFIMPLFVVAAIAVTLGLEWLTRFLPEEQVVFPGSLISLATMILVAAGAITYAIVAAPDLVRTLSHARMSDPRLWLPIVTVGGLAILIIGPWSAARGGRGSRSGLSMAIGLLVVGAFATTQVALTARSLDPGNLAADRGVIDTPAFLIVYTEDRAKIGRAMEPCFSGDDFSIVGGAGAQPYFGRMRSVDVFGLVSDRVAHREPRSRPRAGHTKWGSEQLLAEYDPDFVFSCYRIHRTAAQPQLPCAGFWLRRGFEHVTIKVPGMLEQGEYYTFLARKDRKFECPARVR